MRSIALLVVTGCWTSSPPTTAPRHADTRHERCEPFRAETFTYRGLAYMDMAAAAPVSEQPLVVRPMAGPYSRASAACEDCELSQYDGLANAGRDLAVHLRGAWWSLEVPISDICAVTYDKPLTRDLVNTAPGDELYLHITLDCIEPEHERVEHIVLCGIGSSGKPSCMDAPFGVATDDPESSAHTRMELACDGTVSLTSWAGDGVEFKYARTQHALLFL